MGAVRMSRDEVLLRALHDEHGRVLWSFVMRLTGGDPVRAQDVMQETMLRAWRHPEVLDQAHGSARAWLFTVARRIVIDDWRSRQARPELLTAAEPEQSVPDRTDALLDSWVVEEALSKLSTDHRAVIVECYYKGGSVAQAARTLDIPEGTVKSRTHYALRALKLTLEEMGVTS